MTTRLRETAPRARAMSTRNAGAAKLSVNAATPSRMNSRRVTLFAMVPSSDELILAGSGDESRQPRRLRVHLCVGAGPRPAGVEILEELAHFIRRERGGSEALQHPVEHALRLRALASAERPREVELLIRGDRRREVHPREHLAGTKPRASKLPTRHIRRLEQRLADRKSTRLNSSTVPL